MNIKNDEKNLIFKNLNEIKKTIENEIFKKKLHVLKINTSQDTIDITLPGFGINIGSEHIVSKSITEIKTFFTHFRHIQKERKRSFSLSSIFKHIRFT